MTRTVLRLSAEPLTPVLIGDGSALERLDWRLETAADGGARLAVLDTEAAYASLSVEEEAAFAELLRQGEVGAAVRRLHAHAETRERHALGPEAAAHLDALDDRGDPPILRFMRSRDRLLVPGSSLKGALRTALLAAHAPTRREALRRPPARPDRGPLARLRRLEATALDHQPMATERDPLRYVRTRDLSLPRSRLRIDRIAWLDTEAGGPPMPAPLLAERLRCRADGEPVKPFTLRIELESAADHARRHTLKPQATPAFRPSAGSLWQAIRGRGRDHWNTEREWLARLAPATAASLDRLIAELDLDDPDTALLRLGRFGHAGSKAVPALAPNTSPPETRRISLVEAGDGAEPLWVPFGWLLLRLPRRRPAPGESPENVDHA